MIDIEKVVCKVRIKRNVNEIEKGECK